MNRLLFQDIYFLQRASGLILFTLMAFQIFLGALMPILTKKFGKWVFNYHLTQGIIIASLAIFHPITFLILNFISKKVFDPFYIFTDFCVLCLTKIELYYSFGRFAFWILASGITAAHIRKWNWWKENWRFVHIFNYIVFFLVAIHAWFIGSDIHSIIVTPVYFALIMVVVGSILVRLYLLIKPTSVLLK